jgi:hypothetical protein
VTAVFDPRGEVRRTPVALSVAATFDAESRQEAIVEWANRMVHAHVASRLFAGLLPQMMRADIDSGFQAAAAEAVVDELRHARLCAAVIEALGGQPQAPLPQVSDVPRHDGVAPLEALLRNVLSIVCLDETVAVAQLENRHRNARESTLRRVIAEILDGEINHSRLGWRMLQSLAPRIDAGMRERLGAYLVPAFARLFDEHLGSAGSNPVDSKTVFVDVINEVIVPRLEAVDFPARAAVEAALAAPDAGDDPIAWAATD